MTELEVINATRHPNTSATLIKEFQKLGVQHGDIILMHSSLSSIGWVCGGAFAVIKAIMRTVSDEGTICMPAHTSDNSDPSQWENPPVPKEWIQEICNNMPAFNSLTTPTLCMGKIAELFRTFPNVYRSNHPQGSFSAWGRYAKDITKEHQLTPQFGLSSPLGKLLNLNAKVLLLGVGYENCTCFHVAETMCKQTPKKNDGAAIEENGRRKWIWFQDYDYNSDDFEKIGFDFEKYNDVCVGKVGNASCKLFHMKNAVDFAKQWIESNRSSIPNHA